MSRRTRQAKRDHRTRIFVYCDRHDARVPVVTLVAAEERNEALRWLWWEPEEPTVTRAGTYRGNRPLTDRWRDGHTAINYSRKHWFRCHRCGDEWLVGRERLIPILDKLATEGITEVSLAGLRTALERHSV